jgi:putative transposase
MRERIIVGNIYHVVSRGVDRRKIFLDNKDYFRFIHDLFEFNDQNPLPNTTKTFRKQISSRLFLQNKKKTPRKLLVEILAFCLMPNHYHLLLRPLVEDGLVKFMKRLNMGFAHYFNHKYERTGALFEGRYKSVSITNESHFIYVPYYIHCNPLDLCEPEWREREIKHFREAYRFLEKYRWSSHLDYIGKENFPSVTQRKFLLEIFGGPEKYRSGMLHWLKDMDINEINNLTLDKNNNK